jgi:hypothetical protein
MEIIDDYPNYWTKKAIIGDLPHLYGLIPWYIIFFKKG